MAGNDDGVAGFSGVKKVQQLRALDVQLSCAFMKGMFHNHRAAGLPELARPCLWMVSADTQGAGPPHCHQSQPCHAPLRPRGQCPPAQWEQRQDRQGQNSVLCYLMTIHWLTHPTFCVCCVHSRPKIKPQKLFSCDHSVISCWKSVIWDINRLKSQIQLLRAYGPSKMLRKKYGITKNLVHHHELAGK